MRWLLALLVLAAAPAAAEPWVLGPGVSYHFNRKATNETHFGVGVERRFSRDLSGSLMALGNSHNRLSLYAVGAWTPFHSSDWRAGPMLGLATGYRGRGEKDRQPERAMQPTPFPGLLAAYEGRTFGVNIAFIPASGGVLFLQWKVRWR